MCLKPNLKVQNKDLEQEIIKQDYIYIQKHYTELMQRFPETKERAKRNLAYLKSANISKIIALKGCENCIQTVSKKLDVTENDLCESCRKIIVKNLHLYKKI